MVILDQLNQVVRYVTIFAAIFLVVVLIVSAAKPLQKKYRLKQLSGLKRSSWAAASGLVFGKDKRGQIVHAPISKDGKHAIIIGGSGTGKSTSVIIPSLSHFASMRDGSSDGTGNFFAIDISGDISKAVCPEGSYIFAPCEPNTVPYNVFALIDGLKNDKQAQYEQLEKLAYLIMPDIPGAKDATLFFNTDGRKILTAALTAFYFKGLDFTDICRKVVSSSCIELFREIDAQKDEIASMLIKSFQGTNEANTNGCKQAADGAVKLFALNYNLRQALRRPNSHEVAVTPAALEERSIFFKIPEGLLDVYVPLMSIVVSQFMDHFATRPLGAQPPILLALDEFPSLKMDSTTIVSALQRFRKRNVSIMIVSQSFPALDRIYDPTTRTDMLNNFSYKIVLHAADPGTQMELSKMVGHKTVKTFSKTTGHLSHRQEKNDS